MVQGKVSAADTDVLHVTQHVYADMCQVFQNSFTNFFTSQNYCNETVSLARLLECCYVYKCEIVQVFGMFDFGIIFSVLNCFFETSQHITDKINNDVGTLQVVR
jgi:hypothetical protein